MRSLSDLGPELAADLRAKDVDVARTLSVLDLLEAAPPPASSTLRLPAQDDRRVRDRETGMPLRMPFDEAKRAIDALDVPFDLDFHAEREGDEAVIQEKELERLGILLFPRLAYGVLNGGSATSYADEKKNSELDPAAFDLLGGEFSRAAAAFRDRPKGTTSAFFRKDGSGGPSFLLLKMRALLLRALQYRNLTGDHSTALLPFFQMTSPATEAALRESYREYRNDPLIAPLVEMTGVDPTEPLGAVQPMLAALTHSEQGLPRGIFDRAWGKANSGLALPGGHGENFRVLAGAYRALRDRGVRWAYLGNVDNSGYTIDPVSVAMLALSGADASFEFSWKTRVDVKGGVLVEGGDGKLSVADIGQALSREDLDREEASGKRALFNCATGLFDLDWLVPRLDSIADALPIRVSDQDKEAGRYAQAEQTTWEVLGLMEKPLVLAVAKARRFVAAKTLMETLLASPVAVKLQYSAGAGAGIKAVSAGLRAGMNQLLKTEYGLEAGT